MPDWQKTNLSKNRQNILPYLLSCIGTVVMFLSWIHWRLISREVLTVMGMGTYIIGLFDSMIGKERS